LPGERSRKARRNARHSGQAELRTAPDCLQRPLRCAYASGGGSPPAFGYTRLSGSKPKPRREAIGSELIQGSSIATLKKGGNPWQISMI
jgi:hypothetical protein